MMSHASSVCIYRVLKQFILLVCEQSLKKKRIKQLTARFDICLPFGRKINHMTDGRNKKVQKPEPKPHLHYLPDEDTDDEEEEVEEKGPTLESQFVAFSKVRNQEDPGTHIGLHQINLWLKQAGVLQVRQLTRTDAGFCYFHFKKCKLNFDEYREFIELLANRKRLSAKDMIEKLVNCGPPQGDEG